MSGQGHAAFHLEHNSHGSSGTRQERRKLLKESMRHLDSRDQARQAKRNPNIVVDETGRNRGYVSDGQGGFREAKSVREVLDYGDERLSRVHRKISATQVTVNRFVVHLPKSLCSEVPKFYQRLHDKTNQTSDSEASARSRWEARDHEEAMNYFRDAVDFLAENVIPGGHRAIHGWVTNFDESTPNIKIMADPFASYPKKSDPTSLRTEYSQAYRSHRDIRHSGGPRKGQQIDGPTKLRQYQEKMRNFMVERGYPVESILNERHGKTMPLAEYKKAMDANAAAETLLVAAKNVQKANAARENAMLAKESRLDQELRQLEQRSLDTENQRSRILKQAENHGRTLLKQLSNQIQEFDFGEWVEKKYPEVIDQFENEMMENIPSVRRSGPAKPATLSPARQRHLDLRVGRGRSMAD